MERNKITIAILVSTYALIIITIFLSTSNVIPLDSFDQPDPISKCWSPPTKEYYKQYLWTMPEDWLLTEDIPVHAKFDVYYWLCDTRWVLIYDDLETNATGWILTDLGEPLSLIPGRYKLVLVEYTDIDFTPACCCSYEYPFTITCCSSNTIIETNYLAKVKGGDKAFLFLVNYEYSPLLSRSSEGE